MHKIPCIGFSFFVFKNLHSIIRIVYEEDFGRYKNGCYHF